jgi:lipopolysaccharide export system protein LptA
MPQFSPLILSAVLLLAGAVPASAEKADRFKPLNAEADAMRHDELKQHTLFTGNVIITKGTIVLRGERVEVSQTPDGYQRAIITAAPGKVAFWRNKRDGVDETIEAEAELIEYDGKADVVQLTRKAVLRRFASGTLADETSGAVIRYDNGRELFTVDGEPRNLGGGGTRVRAQLSPRQQPPAASGAPGAPALRPSPALSPQK